MGTERSEKIMRILQVQKDATVLELASMLKVSDMTIRRDLTELENQGLVTRYHGGAFITAMEPQGILPAYHPDYCQESKQEIGKYASQLLKDQIYNQQISSVVLMPGSTMLEMVNSIDYTIPVTAITNSLSIASRLSLNANNNVVIFGGRIYMPTQSTNGFLAEQMLNSLSPDCTYMSITAIDQDGSFYCFDEADASFLQKLCQLSQKIYLLVDSSKFNNKCLVRAGKINSRFEIITDKGIPDNCKTNYEKLGVKITIT